MIPTDAQTLVNSFNACINARDLSGLMELMTDDHVFIDKSGNRVIGKNACENAWRGFFAAFPDYRNSFEETHSRTDIVVMSGRSSCSDSRLAGPALWTARIHNGRVCEWRVMEDTDHNRKNLSLRTSFG